MLEVYAVNLISRKKNETERNVKNWIRFVIAMTTLSRMRFIDETHQKPFKMNGNATLVAQAVMRSLLLLTTMNFYFAHVKCKWTPVINLWDFHNEDFQVLLSVTGNMAIVQYLYENIRLIEETGYWGALVSLVLNFGSMGICHCVKKLLGFSQAQNWMAHSWKRHIEDFDYYIKPDQLFESQGTFSQWDTIEPALCTLKSRLYDSIRR